MNNENSLIARVREARGKGPARRLRQQGLVPGIFYHHGNPSIPFAISTVDLRHLLRGKHTLISLAIEGQEPRECVLREVQRDPVSSEVLHIDLMGILADEKLVVEVPIRMAGVPEGVKTGGGILQSGLKTLSIECFPRDIPEFVEVDVSALKIGQSMHVSHLSYPNLRILDDAQDTVASVQPPTVLKEAKPAAEVAAEVEAAAAAEAAPAEGAEAAAKEKETEKPAKDEKKPAKGEKKPARGEKK